MKSLKTELYLLRWNLLLLTVCLVIAGFAATSLAAIGRDSAARTRQAEESAMRVRNEANRLQSDEQEMRRMIARYQGIVARGIIGPEKRLEWVEQIRAIRQERKLLDVQYEIYPQAPLPAGLVAAGGDTGHEWRVSTMRVHIPLLHEEDLTHFIADLRATAPAFVRLRECRLTRAGALPEGRQAELPPQVNAECRIDWISLLAKPGSATEGVRP